MQNLIQHSMTPLMPTVKANGGEQQPSLSPLVSDSVFDPHSYRSVHNLATNADKRPFEDLIKKTAIAIFMAKCLKFNGFFGHLDTKDGRERATATSAAAADTRRAEIFVSSLLLRHLQIAATNGLEMAECLLKNGDVTKFDIIPVGGAIFPTMSFFNHSCYPNSLRLGYQSYQVLAWTKKMFFENDVNLSVSQQVVRVIRSIHRGEEVNIDYGFDCYANPKEARAKRSTSQYFFSCQCVACRENWPLYNELAGSTRQLKVKPSQAVSEELGRQVRFSLIAITIYILKMFVF